MHIYNTTINVDTTIQDQWLKWMQEEQIPAILATGKFSGIRICEVLIEEEMGGTTFAIQYTSPTQADLKTFLRDYADGFDSELLKKFQGKYGIFSTELRIISEH